MRDLDTISATITAAETGHLVISTLHTTDAAQTIDRMIDVFRRISNLKLGYKYLRLLADTSIRNLIREGRTYEILTYIRLHAEAGSQSLDDALANLVQSYQLLERRPWKKPVIRNIWLNYLTHNN